MVINHLFLAVLQIVLETEVVLLPTTQVQRMVLLSARLASTDTVVSSAHLLMYFSGLTESTLRYRQVIAVSARYMYAVTLRSSLMQDMTDIPMSATKRERKVLLHRLPLVSMVTSRQRLLAVVIAAIMVTIITLTFLQLLLYVAFSLAVLRFTVRPAASFTRARITLPRTRMRVSPLAFASYLLHNRSDTARHTPYAARHLLAA